jgi:hypothetical protein
MHYDGYMGIIQSWYLFIDDRVAIICFRVTIHIHSKVAEWTWGRISLCLSYYILVYICHTISSRCLVEYWNFSSFNMKIMKSKQVSILDKRKKMGMVDQSSPWMIPICTIGGFTIVSNNLNQIGIESKQIKVACWQMLPQNVGGGKGVTCKLINHYFLESSDGEWFSMWEHNDYWAGVATWEIP